MIKRPVNPYLKVYRPLFTYKTTFNFNPEVLETTLALRATQWAFLRHTPPHRPKTNHSPKSPPVLNLQAACSVCVAEFARLQFQGKSETELVRGDVQLGDGIVGAFFAPVG